jgi:mannose-6-phosphate isomerase-like protein (cupin superfamily)
VTGPAARIFCQDDLDWKVVDVRGTPMMEARVMNGESGIYSAFYRLPKGTEIRPHRHENWVQVMVISGCMSITEEDEVSVVNAGGCYVVAAGGRHSEKSLVDTLVLVTSPDP